jgi:ATP-dependent Zn protease
MTVVMKYEDFVENRVTKDSKTEKLLKKVEDQYEYALDHLQEIVKQSKEEMTAEATHRYKAIDMMMMFLIFGVAGYAMSKYGPASIREGLFKGQQNNFNFEIKKAHNIETRLSDVKGITEIRDEIQDLIKMIKNSEDYTSKGAKLYKGVLLAGQPGTGKTLLARAIAGESQVNFLYCTGSNFDEMYVGLGAKRVRELFAEARKNVPCIIFIDEIDSLMSKTRRFGNEHSSSRGTLN